MHSTPYQSFKHQHPPKTHSKSDQKLALHRSRALTFNRGPPPRVSFTKFRRPQRERKARARAPHKIPSPSLGPLHFAGGCCGLRLRSQLLSLPSSSSTLSLSLLNKEKREGGGQAAERMCAIGKSLPKNPRRIGDEARPSIRELQQSYTI